jgi:DNA-binding response OmpR family regulator
MAKVLIIDDDQTMQSLYQRILLVEGFEVEVAPGGLAGLEKAQSFHPDIILLDMMMPGVNGLEVLGKLKSDEKVKDIPVIVMSNYSELNITTHAMQLGANQYLIKSDTEPSELVGVIRATLA